MLITHNRALARREETASLQLLASGNALCDNKWCATEPSPPYTRLYYIAEGEAFVKTAHGALTLKAGHLYLLPAGCAFSYHCDTQMRQLYFHVNLLGSEGYDLLRSISRVLYTPLDDEYIRELLALYAADSRAELLYLRALVKRDVMALLCREGITLEAPAYSACVTKALHFIEENLSASLSLKTVAECTFVSPHTLTHKFKQEMGTSVGQYIEGLVLFKAEQLLLSTDLPLSQISEQLGFYDQFYFSRRFKEHFSVPPLVYRKTHRFTEV